MYSSKFISQTEEMILKKLYYFKQFQGRAEFCNWVYQRSSNITMYFIWHLKSIVYSTPLKNIRRLKNIQLGCTTRCQNIWETSKVLKLKNSNWSSTSFSTAFLISQKCPTMSPHQEAIASSTSSLIWGLKQFTTMVESPTRPWSSLSCFESTPSIQVSK